MGERTGYMIDLHSHVLPDGWPDFNRGGVTGFPVLEGDGDERRILIDGRFFRAVDRTSYDIEYRIEAYARHGVQIQVVCTVPVMFSYHLPAEPAARFTRVLNEHIARLQQDYPDRVIGLGALPLQDTARAIAELEYCAEELGLPGVQIGSNVNQRNLDNPELFEVFTACSELGMAVLVHPWQMIGSDVMPDYWLPWLVGMPAELSRAICCMIFGGVFERLPGLRVCFAHGGGGFPFNIGRIEHGFKMRPDLVATRNPVNPREYLGRFWVDSVTHDARALAYLLEVIGTGKVALGTDYPFPLGEQDPGAVIRALELDPEVEARLCWKNTLEFLNLPEGRYGP